MYMAQDKLTHVEEIDGARDPRILRHLDYLRCNGDPDATYADAEELMMQDCGRLPADLGGVCQLAGSEYCDFECPWRDG